MSGYARYTRVRSKNHSCDELRHQNKGIGPFPVRSLVRFGSRTDTEVVFPKSYGKHPIIEVNTVLGIENSRSKIAMKTCFDNAEVAHMPWSTAEEMRDKLSNKNVHFPMLAKRIFGYKGKGMSKIDNEEQLEEWFNTHKDLTGWYFEKYFSGNREYRLHITNEGCFMAWRKLRREDAPKDKRWYFNSDYCNWVGEDHDLFNKPRNWDAMVREAVKAINAIGLDIGCVDLRTQGSESIRPRFYIIEINSAPALADQGLTAYKEKITDIINDKIREGDYE